MCGIAGFHSLDGKPIAEAGRFANELLLSIENRGRDATGILAVGPSGKTLDKYTVPASRFIRGRELFKSDSRTVLCHTRFATTGHRGSVKDAHPHVSGSIAAIHNGTIYNADELFKAFSLPRNATVDSEVIPALVSYAGWGQAEAALSLMQGGAATALVDVTNPGELILARVRDYPLCWATVGNVLVFASTAGAIREAWRYAYGQQIKATIKSMVPGEVLRANGKITHSEIPGVYGVEKEWTSKAWIRKPAKAAAKAAPTKAATKSKGKSKRGAKIKVTTPLTHCATEKEQQLRLDAIKRGTQPKPGEIMALIDALEQARAERDEADMLLSELGVEDDLEWDDDRADYSPERWAS